MPEAPDVPTLEELPAASSLLSSRWSRDNLITSHPGRLYDGKVLELVGLDTLKELLARLEAQRGPVHPGATRIGVHTWDVQCSDARGPFVLQVPLVLDEVGTRGRAKRDVPRLNVENMRALRAAGLTRYVAEPRGMLALGAIPAAAFPALTEHRPVTFGGGALRVELLEANRSFLLSLGPGATAELLSEMVAALTYHYDASESGGTAITDVCVNDGDFVARRRADGSFDVRLTAVRRRDGGIGPSLLLLYLVQLMAYEDWNVDGELTGLPVLVSNPSIAFEGLVRGRRYRYRDLGLAEERGVDEAHGWLASFARSPEGRSYRPWVERFLQGRLPLGFGADLRERWWRLIPLTTKLGLLELRARVESSARAASSARAVKAFVAGLSQAIGHTPHEEPGTVRLNDLGREALSVAVRDVGLSASEEARVSADLFEQWPYRSWDHLLARAPSARALKRLKSRFSFGPVVSHAEQGTLKALEKPRSEEPGRLVANHELFGLVRLPAELHAEAAATFPTFESYMDAALHAPAWGYYGHGVVIGTSGHFDTHPETLSPHYGRWIARVALNAWRALLDSGDLAESDELTVVELGAGNGRLARDLLDAVAKLASDSKAPDQASWAALAARLRYRIYETSAALRQKQQALLGGDAVVVEGDARRPGAALKRDFPGGLRGLVITNEVPDAFGVHKVLLTREGHPFAILVLPRVEAVLGPELGGPLARRLAETDARLRERFALGGNRGDQYLDAAAFAAVMDAIAALPGDSRETARSRLWFEEALVPAAVLPELSAHLAENAGALATALAAEDSGVVTYVNVHAARFVRELGAALRAGFAVTIDYGDTTWGLVQGARRGEQPFRVYGDWQDYVPRPNDPYAAPGTQDLTADVDFTSLARAGRDVGLTVVHFGLERGITGKELPLALRGADDPIIAKFLGNPVFKVLVLGTRSAALLDGAEASALPLTHGEELVPKARRDLIAAIERNLARR